MFKYPRNDMQQAMLAEEEELKNEAKDELRDFEAELKALQEDYADRCKDLLGGGF